tara:strand:+ start:23 stop:175 length:153 start_codon:yes stop_codon:yes gene_type:complete
MKKRTHLLELITKDNKIIKKEVNLLIELSDKFAFNLWRTKKYKRIKLTLK